MVSQNMFHETTHCIKRVMTDSYPSVYLHHSEMPCLKVLLRKLRRQLLNTVFSRNNWNIWQQMMVGMCVTIMGQA